MNKTLVSSSTFNGVEGAWRSHTPAFSQSLQVLSRHDLSKTMGEDRPSSLYDLVEETLKFLSSRDPEDQDYVKPEAAHRAIAVLYILRHARIPAPRILPGEDGEDVTFTWDSPDVKRLLTIAAGNLNVTHVHRPTRRRAFKKYSAVIEKPNEVLAQIGEPPSYLAGVTSY